ncbi:MAG: hypothetical protein HQ503_04330 [Rhodospirillales bacterium]|nr:hypothetical protein [Rhodospirillales bacterium]
MAGKPIKIIGGLIGAVVVIAVTALIAVFVFAGDVIKTAVEELGPQLTKASVKLDKVDLSLATGEAALSGLLIGNPAGFKTPHAFKLGKIGVKIDTGSIGKDTIVIREILIDGPDVIAEFKELNFNPLKADASVQSSLKTSNFIAIQNNVDAYIKSQGGEAGTKPGSSGQAAKSGSAIKDEPKLIIEKLRMNNINVRAVSHSGLKLDTALKPFSIALNDIGKKENGLPPSEIAAALISKIQGKIMESMTGDLTKVAIGMADKLGGVAKEGLKAATEGVPGVGKLLGDGAKGAAGVLGDGAKGAAGALKGLFGK